GRPKSARSWRFDRRPPARISGADMTTMGRIRSLWAVINSAIDGGARAWEAERRAEHSRLTFREGRAVPQHIAIIMDGNGRWATSRPVQNNISTSMECTARGATSRHLPRSLGHPAGVEALRRVVRLCDAYR